MQKSTDEGIAKMRLHKYTNLLNEIDNQFERLEHIAATMTSASSANLSGMPKSPGVKTDRTTTLVIRKMEIEKAIRDAIKAEQAERAAIELLLQGLKADERAVIRLRYFDRAGWPEVCDIMFGHEKNYDERVDYLMRKTFRLHGTALLGIEQAMTK